MNILFISNKNSNKEAGLYWSIPNQVRAQSLYDNVMWYNDTYEREEYWMETGLYYNIDDYPSRNISDFKEPFNKPDLIVFEGFYWPVYDLFRQVKRLKIPYVIIPRGSLTKNAQSIHPFKKMIGNFFFRRFTNKALAIHYLTQAEYEDSGRRWNDRYVIIPNGVINVSQRQWKKKEFNVENRFRGVFIGRISMYHKGLDLLIDACESLQDMLRQSKIIIDIYGPDRENHRSELMSRIRKAKVSDIIILHKKSLLGKDKETELINSDFFVLTSRLEGHPMGLIEALSYGIPVLVTRGSNMYEEISHGRCGWVSENTIEGIKSSLLKLINTNNNQMSLMSANAIKLAKDYQWESIAKITHAKYQKLIEDK